MVEGVLGQLRHTQTVLDDLNESLKVGASSSFFEATAAVRSISSICM
jgi:hypothetical protein